MRLAQAQDFTVSDRTNIVDDVPYKMEASNHHPETGTPISVEHGPWHSDEITVLENGGNAGWDPRPNMTLPMEPGRFRSVVLGPDGSLYTAVDEGVIHKLPPRSRPADRAVQGRRGLYFCTPTA